MTYFVVIVRGGGGGPVVAGLEVEAPGPRTAAARALVAAGRRRRGRRPPPSGDVVGEVAGALAAAGRWTVRAAPGCVLEAWAYRDPLGGAGPVAVCVSSRGPGGRPGPSPN